MDNKTSKVIAVDFDGCLCDNRFPAIGLPNWAVIAALRKEKMFEGTKIILWTCREGETLESALEACKTWGIEIDAVNDNLPELKEKWGNNPRKIAADEYWDDRAVIARADGVIRR